MLTKLAFKQDQRPSPQMQNDQNYILNRKAGISSPSQRVYFKENNFPLVRIAPSR